MPWLGEVTVDLTHWLPLVDRATWLTPADRGVLHAAADRLRPLLTPGDDDVTLHGDAHPHNILATADGPLWIDFEDACRGPREWDYVTTGVADGSPYAELRSLQVALCRIATRDDIADVEGPDAGVGPFIAHLADALPRRPRAIMPE